MSTADRPSLPPSTPRPTTLLDRAPPQPIPDHVNDTGAHPRACGEHVRPSGVIVVYSGSSPRVRGARCPRISSTSVHGAHPRACGEHTSAMNQPVAKVGSSPRVRGAHPVPFGAFFRNGLIPARAGSTKAPSPRIPAHRAHPRACGEHRRCDARVRCDRGSSPRVRGAPGQRVEPLGGRGLIPARAGSTPVARSAPRLWGAHPRACGEH